MAQKARYSAADLSQQLRQLQWKFARRDTEIAVWRALTYRRFGEVASNRDGTYLPKPFHQSELVLRYMTGILGDRAHQVAATISENQPIVRVQNISSTPRKVGQRQSEKAATVADALNGIWWSGGGDEIQDTAAWAQVTEGCGWIVAYETLAGFGLPDRRFFEQGELSAEDIAQLRARGEVVALPAEDSGQVFAESADLWQRRRLEASREHAINGVSLMTFEMQPHGNVWYRTDKPTGPNNLKMLAVIEQVPAADFGPGSAYAQSYAEFTGDENVVKAGLILSRDGKIVVGGLERIDGGQKDQRPQERTWWLARCLYRDEIYYFVSPTRAMTGGVIVFHTGHDYGEVPAYPAWARHTSSRRPEEEYRPLFDGAYATIPGFNQVVTLLSNVATFNATPRYVIELPSEQGGGFELDDEGEVKVIDGASAVGLDPSKMEEVSGTVKQLTIEDGELILQLAEFYQKQLEATLPSAVATGTGGESGPAWTTRLMQQAQNVKIAPAVKGFASACEGAMKLTARVIRKRQSPIVVLSAPGFGTTEDDERYLITLDPEDVSENLAVRLDPNTQQDRLVLQQVGVELREKGHITDDELYRDYFGKQDVRGTIRRKYIQLAVDHLMTGQAVAPGSIIDFAANLARGRIQQQLVQRSPIAAHAAAEAAAAAEQPPPEPETALGPSGASLTAPGGRGLAGAVDQVAGREAGRGMPPTQPAMPAPPSTSVSPAMPQAVPA